jgi:ribonuclease T2
MKTALVFLGVFSALASGFAPSRALAETYVLAISWQPAFCELAGRKPECRSQRAESADARQFSLHGLWPQPSSRAYCGIAASEIEASKGGRWRDIDIAFLPQPLWRRLQAGMPGTRSNLHRHEWVKHGSCIDGADEERYFEASLDLLDSVNSSPLARLFAENIGKSLSADTVRAAFELGFGTGSGLRLRISCAQDGNRRIIRELTIGLVGDPFVTEMKDLVAAASPTDAGCPAGIVDQAGQQ